jgi:hypothetical protein
MTCTFSQANALERLKRTRTRIPATRQVQRKHHVLEGCERRDQVKGLEHESNALRSQARAPVLVQHGEIGSVQPDFA